MQTLHTDMPNQFRQKSGRRRTWNFRQAVQNLANGYSLKQVAAQQNVSYRVMQEGLARGRLKYKATSNQHLCAIFIRRGWID